MNKRLAIYVCVVLATALAGCHGSRPGDGAIFDTAFCGTAEMGRWEVMGSLRELPPDQQGGHREHGSSLFPEGALFAYDDDNRLVMLNDTGRAADDEWTGVGRFPCTHHVESFRFGGGLGTPTEMTMKISGTTSYGELEEGVERGGEAEAHKHYIWVVHFEFVVGEQNSRVFCAGVDNSPAHLLLARAVHFRGALGSFAPALSKTYAIENNTAVLRPFVTADETKEFCNSFLDYLSGDDTPAIDGNVTLEIKSHNGRIHGRGN